MALPGDTNDSMRDRSGAVRHSSAVTQFIYLLARDHLPPGKIEEIMGRLSTREVFYTNGWLAQYADDVRERLETGKASFPSLEERGFPWPTEKDS